MMEESQSASEDIDNAYKWRCIPFDGDGSIYLVVPEAWSRDVKSAVGFLHDDAISNELEVAIGIGDGLQDLH